MTESKQKIQINKETQQKVYECFCSKKYNSYAGLYLHLKSKHQSAFSLYKNMKLSKLLICHSDNSTKNIYKLKQPVLNQKQQNSSQHQKYQYQNKTQKQKQKHLINKQKENQHTININNKVYESLTNSYNHIPSHNIPIIDYSSSLQTYNNMLKNDKKLSYLPSLQISPIQHFYHQNYLQSMHSQQLHQYQQYYNNQPSMFDYQYFPLINFVPHQQNYQFNKNQNYYHNLTNFDLIDSSGQTKIHNDKNKSSIKSQNDIKSPNHYKRFFIHSQSKNHQQNHKHNDSQ